MEDGEQIHVNQERKTKASGFAQYGFFYELYRAILVNGLKMPTPVQRKTIPVLMSGKDAIVCYKTGSGKTLAYLLPMINKLKCHSTLSGARGLILVPTKDLAEQIAAVLKTYLKGRNMIDLRYSLILGGHTYEGQFNSLATNPDIIIATPGRLMELVVDTDLRLGRVEMIVFDEADQLFQNSSLTAQLKQILQKCPMSQRLMFSATINENLNDFAKACLKEYSYIHQEIALPETMTLDAFIVRSGDKIGALLYILEKMVPNEKVIVFASTRFHVDYLVALIGMVTECFGIYGKMDVDQRSYALDNFRKKKGSVVLVVTDVAARGLDIPFVKYVIHYDYPTNHKTFVHRSGRTARKNLEGHTIALISHNQLPFVTELSQFVSRKLTLSSDTHETINYGSFPIEILDSYALVVKRLKEKNEQVLKFQELANRAFDKFQKCRTQTSQNSVKKSKKLLIETHYKFQAKDQDEDQQNFMKRIHNFIPKKSFLQLQHLENTVAPENDVFLSAVQNIRKNHQEQRKQQIKRQKLRKGNSEKWREILEKEQIRELQQYQQERNKQHIPIKQVEGVEIQMSRQKKKKSEMRDFKNVSQYIQSIKDPSKKTQFDDLPRIKNHELDQNIGDENPHKRKVRKWDKTKKNFVWTKDAEDKMTKDDKGKKAYTKWKKKSRLSLPKLGQIQDQHNTKQAKENWLQSRKFRHGWKQNKEKGEQQFKNNKTKAINKKFKKKLISKSMRSKGKPTRKMK